jgi:hypothetical protein
MSDVDKPANPSQPDAKATVRSPSGARRMVMTAARKAPPDLQTGPIASRLRSGAENAALNALARAKESWSDFRRADRYAKHKVLIVALWTVLSAATIIIAFPRSTGASNSLGARLAVTTVLDHSVYMVSNDGTKTWTDVVIVVNNRYRAAASEIQPGQNVTVGPKQLIGENGVFAPATLALEELELRTSQGHTKLVEGGEHR